MDAKTLIKANLSSIASYATKALTAIESGDEVRFNQYQVFIKALAMDNDRDKEKVFKKSSIQKIKEYVG